MLFKYFLLVLVLFISGIVAGKSKQQQNIVVSHDSVVVSSGGKSKKGGGNIVLSGGGSGSKNCQCCPKYQHKAPVYSWQGWQNGWSQPWSQPWAQSWSSHGWNIAVVVAFFVCWAPFHSQRLMASLLLEPTPTQIFLFDLLTNISGITYYLSATINPILYSIMSLKFRQAFKDTLKIWCFKSKNKPLANVVNFIPTNATHYLNDDSRR